MRAIRRDVGAVRTRPRSGARSRCWRHRHGHRPHATAISCRTSISPRRACSSTRTTPTANPAEQVTRGDCSNKAAIQDLAGHGTHTAGRSPRRSTASGSPASLPRPRSWCSRPAPRQGYFFTESVVDALTLCRRSAARRREHELLRRSVAVQLSQRQGAEGDHQGDHQGRASTPSSGASCSSRPPATRAST